MTEKAIAASIIEFCRVMLRNLDEATDKDIINDFISYSEVVDNRLAKLRLSDILNSETTKGKE